MPCNLDVICYIDQYSEVARKSNFIVNAVGIVSSRHQKVNIYVHIVAFYPKEESRDSDLEKFNKGDIIKVQGRFSIIETEVQGNKIKVIKMVACDICVLNLNEQDLPQSSLSVVLIGVASDNSDVSDDKVTLNMIAREYIDNQNNESLSFELYHFPNDAHLLPTSSKVLRGSSLYVTGNLSIIDELLLVRITQINFIGQMHSNPQKSSNYAWEKKQMDSSSTQVSSTPSPADIAKSISDKSKKRGKSQGTSLLSHQKIPKLSSLSLPQVITDDEDTHIEDSSSSLPQPNTESDHQEETQTDMENNEKPQRPKRGRGGRRKK